MRRQITTAIGVAAFASALSCSPGNNTELGSALEHQKDRSAGDSFERPWSTVDELLAFIEVNHDREGYGGVRAVVGTFVEAERGVAMRWDESADADRMIVLPYGDPDGVVESVHFTFDVAEDLAPHAGKGDGEVQVGVAFEAGFDFETIRNDYLSLGTVVLFLEQSPVFAYEAGTYGILDDGLLLGIVDDAGNVEFPIARDQASFTPQSMTVEDLRADPH